MSIIRPVISPVVKPVANTVASSTGEILPPTEPPAIITNPLNVSVPEGEYWEMYTRASKYDSVQWQFSSDGGSNYSNATGFDGASELTPTLYENSADIGLNGYLFKALYTNIIGTSETLPAFLSVTPPISNDFLYGDFLVGDFQTIAPPPPVITLQPVAQSVAEGETATFDADATGYDSVQWQKDNVDIAGAIAISYTTPVLALGDSGAVYKAIFTNAAASTVTDEAALTVTIPLPVITLQPVAQAVVEPATATFTADATGYDVVIWQKNDGTIEGATSASYTTPPTVIGDDGALYHAVFGNGGGYVVSDDALLTVALAPPVVTLNPVAISVQQGSTGNFTADATGYDSVQWRKDAVDISGATAISYTTPAALVGDDGASFDAVFTNAGGTATTTAAIMTVTPYPLPVVTLNPVSQSVVEGLTAAFTSLATDYDSVQWQKNDVDIAGATLPDYTTPATTLADTGATFKAIYTNIGGTATTTPAVLTVTPDAISLDAVMVLDISGVAHMYDNWLFFIGSLTPDVLGANNVIGFSVGTVGTGGHQVSVTLDNTLTDYRFPLQLEVLGSTFVLPINAEGFGWYDTSTIATDIYNLLPVGSDIPIVFTILD